MRYSIQRGSIVKRESRATSLNKKSIDNLLQPPKRIVLSKLPEFVSNLARAWARGRTSTWGQLLEAIQWSKLRKGFIPNIENYEKRKNMLFLLNISIFN